MSTVAYPHIELGSNGTAFIAGTGFKVRMLVEEHLASGADAAELQRRHPQLTPGQVYAALAYYHDHKSDLDHEIDELAKSERELRPQLESPTIAEKLRKAMKERKARE
jgi:uncharacterized protein (DUF433 family)